MKKFQYLSISVGSALLTLSAIAMPLTTRAWTTSLETKGPLRVSNDGAVTGFLTENDEAREEVVANGKNGERIWSFTQDKTLNQIALSGNGKYIAAVGNGVSLLSITEKKMLWNFPQDGRDTVAISTDGTWVVAGGYKANVYIFKKDSSRVVKKWDLGKKEDSPRAVAVSDDGKVAVAATNQAVYLFDTNAAAVKWTAKTDTSEGVQQVTMSRDGRFVLGLAAHTVYLWDKKSNAPLWKKKWNESLIGAAMSANADKIVVSSQKGVSVFNTKGEEVRHFDNGFGNSDVAMSANGRYFYVNSGGTRLYAFDDSFDRNEMRPFRIIRNINAGGNRSSIVTSGAGNRVTYPEHDDMHVEESTPAVLALSPGIPVLLKGATLDMGAFITNPSIATQGMSVKVTLALAETEWWSKLTSSMNANESTNVRSKLLAYEGIELPGRSVIHDETVNLSAGASKTIHFSATVPDLAGGSSFSDKLAGGMSALSPAALVSNLLDKIKGPLSKLIGNDAANIAIATTNRTISGATGQMTYPMLGMGAVTLYDAQGKSLDEDSFYFMYLR